MFLCTFRQIRRSKLAAISAAIEIACGIQAHKLANMVVNGCATLAAMALLLAPFTSAKQCGTNKKAVCGAYTCSI